MQGLLCAGISLLLLATGCISCAGNPAQRIPGDAPADVVLDVDARFVELYGPVFDKAVRMWRKAGWDIDYANVREGRRMTTTVLLDVAERRGFTTYGENGQQITREREVIASVTTDKRFLKVYVPNMDMYPREDYRLQIFLHELGHVAGLKDSYLFEDKNTLMYGITDDRRPCIDKTTADKLGLQPVCPEDLD